MPAFDGKADISSLTEVWLPLIVWQENAEYRTLRRILSYLDPTPMSQRDLARKAEAYA